MSLPVVTTIQPLAGIERNQRFLDAFKELLYRNYRRSSSLKYWFRRRLTPAGLLVLAGMLAAGGIGIDTNLTVAYQGFTLLLALLLVSFGWRFGFRPNVSARRFLPRYGTAGIPLKYRVELVNHSKKVERSLTLLDNPADPRPTLKEFIEIPEPGEARRNAFDRTFCYYRWSWLTARKQTAHVREHALPPLAPGVKTDVTVELLPLRRGMVHLRSMTVAAPDPFGLVRSLRDIAAPQSLLVLPKRYFIPTLALPGTRQYQQGGVALAASVGESEEFMSLRDYRRGDPLRHVHWRSSVKTGELIVKEFQDEFFVRHALILDTFLDRPQDQIFEEAVSIAASFACTIQTQDSLLDLMFVGPQAFCFTAGRGVGHTEQILEILASVNPCTEQPFDRLEHLVMQHLAAVSGCIAVFLDWDEARRNLVRKIEAQGIPLKVLVVTDASSKRRIEAIPVAERPASFHILEAGRIAEGLLRL
ncbi:MAG: DUF58 domain-containing protein [Verrucomicrobiota bacterium]